MLTTAANYADFTPFRGRFAYRSGPSHLPWCPGPRPTITRYPRRKPERASRMGRLHGAANADPPASHPIRRGSPRASPVPDARFLHLASYARRSIGRVGIGLSLNVQRDSGGGACRSAARTRAKAGRSSRLCRPARRSRGQEKEPPPAGRSSFMPRHSPSCRVCPYRGAALAARVNLAGDSSPTVYKRFTQTYTGVDRHDASAKGLEFRAVAVLACDDEVLPLQERIEAVAGDADLGGLCNSGVQSCQDRNRTFQIVETLVAGICVT